MSTKQEEMEKVALERDRLLKDAEEAGKIITQLGAEIVEARSELAAFQTAAREQAEKIRAACPPPEAGFSLNAQFGAGKVITGGQITFRTVNAQDWRMAFDEFESLAKERGWKFAPAAIPAEPPAPNRAATIAREAGNETAAKAIEQAAAVVPLPPDGKTWLTLDAVRILLLPQPDTRIKIEFYADGHKFPDLKTTWTAEQIAGLLKHVTSQDVTKAADLALRCRVYYTLGKEYQKPDGTKGNYKDIAHVRPL